MLAGFAIPQRVRQALPQGAADLHMHTSCSDGRDSPRRLVERVRRARLQVIAVTDHDTIAGAVEAQRPARELGAQFEVVIGEEVSSADGHVLGLFLTEIVPPLMTAAETIRAIHEQGGIAIAAHPLWSLRASRSALPSSTGYLAAHLDFDAIETLNGAPNPFMWAANRGARELALRAGKPMVGGSDAHLSGLVGSTVTHFPGRTAAELRRALESGAVEPARRAYLRPAAAGYLPWALSLAPGLTGRTRLA